MSDVARFLIAGLLAGLIGFATELAAEDQQSLPVSAAVKTFSDAGTAPMPSDNGMVMRAAEPPVATLPDERLPQYQTRYQRREFLSQHENVDGEIRFLLSVPTVSMEVATPILVRATIRIDDAPFTAPRQQRIESILGSLETARESEKAIAAKIPTSDLIENKDESGDNDSTNTQETASDELASEEIDAEELDANGPSLENVPYQLTTESSELIRRYAEAIGEPIALEEAGWVLNHWTEGPTLLLLQPYFQSFRAHERPAFQILDRDRDGRISSQERSEAVASFQKCDANRDDIVDALEIAQSAKALGDHDENSATARPLLMLLADLQQITRDDPNLFAIIAAFDDNQSGELDAEEIRVLEKQTPDIDLIVHFVTGNPVNSKLTLVATNADIDAKFATSTQFDGVDVEVDGVHIHFSAVQNLHSDQISLGAVVDGYPLLPMLDPNGDGRFTLRELRQLEQRLSKFDKDGDGELSLLETRSPVRVCFGLGAIVHRELAGLRNAKQTDSTPSILGPDWFIRMDRNGDNDLTRGEFPGLDEQFAALDADDDELISASEALQFESKHLEPAE